MAHFALIKNTIVQQVIVVGNADLTNSEGNEQEALGVAFCHSLFGTDETWIQTSYNGNFRYRYAGIGMVYNNQYDVFLLPQPYPSWTLNTETYEWDSPVPEPELTEEQKESGSYYEWNEETQEWKLTFL